MFPISYYYVKEQAMELINSVCKGIQNDEHDLDKEPPFDDQDYTKKKDLLVLSEREKINSYTYRRIYTRRVDIFATIDGQKKFLYKVINRKRKNTGFLLLSLQDGEEVKPYFYNGRNRGILDEFTHSPMCMYIQELVTNICRILKSTVSSKGLKTIPHDDELNKKLINASFEFALLLLLSERFISEKSLITAYFGLIILKKITNVQESIDTLEYLINDFFIFSQNGGKKKIIKAQPDDIMLRFEELYMRNYSYEGGEVHLLRKIYKLKAILCNEHTPTWNNQRNGMNNDNDVIKNVEIKTYLKRWF